MSKTYTVTVLTNGASATGTILGDTYTCTRDYLDNTLLQFFTGDKEKTGEVLVANGHTWSVVRTE